MVATTMDMDMDMDMDTTMARKKPASRKKADIILRQAAIKVSIIIPVYKVEKYLRKCLDSVVAQTYQNIEVFLVDDGSPDDCGNICEEYAAKDPRFKVIRQKNQGLSAARNNAVPYTTGEYITFIDSDDFVTPDYVEFLVSLVNKYCAEISVGKFIFQYENKPIKLNDNEFVSAFYLPEEALQKMNYGQGFSVHAWGKLYKRELVVQNKYPVGKLYEDLATTYKLVGESTGVAYGTKKIYYWVQRAGSIMNSEFNEKQFDGLEAAYAQLKYIKKLYPGALQAAKVRFMGKIVELMSIAFKSKNGKAVYKRLKNEMLFYNEVMADKKAKKSLKFRLLAMKTGYYPAKLFFYIHNLAKETII